MTRLRNLLLLALPIFIGCTHLGPKTIPRDRFDYNAAISNSWKEQTLLNIVKLRYADMPLFVEVASVVSGYQLEGTVNLGGTVSSPNAIQGDFLNFGTSGKYIDRPTITYAPITGTQFNKSFMTPIPPHAVLFLMQSGWSVDLIFPITVDSISGLKSNQFGGLSERAGDEDFYRTIELFSKIQKSGAAGMRVQKNQEGLDTTVLFFYRENLSPEARADIKEFSELLGIDPGLKEVKVAYGFLPGSSDEIAMITRSMLQIMIDLALQVDVPEAHIKEGRTIPSKVDSSIAADEIKRNIQIHHSTEPIENPYVSVKYRGHYYYIDDQDFNSKRTFAFLMILFSLTEAGGKEGLPLVTIAAGG